MYRKFYLSDLNPYIIRSGTYGYQPKYLTRDGEYFVKEQAVLGGELKNDWKAEMFACRVANILKIPCVQQKPCKIIYSDNKFRYGVYSKNFEKQGFYFVPFECLMSLVGKPFNITEYRGHKTATEKLEFIVSQMNMVSKIPISDLRQYMLQLACLDILICNVDRHIKNFGILQKDGYTCSPVFDNGMSLMESIENLDYYKDLNSCSGELYIEPYGEDPFDLLEEFDKSYGIKNYIRPRINQFLKLEGFPNEFAREYFNLVLRRCRDGFNGKTSY